MGWSCLSTAASRPYELGGWDKYQLGSEKHYELCDCRILQDRGQALAQAFARKNINVTVANRRSPEASAPQARAIGSMVVAKSLRDALDADTIILAVPFWGNTARLRRLCRAGKARRSSTRRTRLEFPLKSWAPPCPPSSRRRSLTLSFVKGFNHLGAAIWLPTR